MSPSRLAVLLLFRGKGFFLSKETLPSSYKYVAMLLPVQSSSNRYPAKDFEMSSWYVLSGKAIRTTALYLPELSLYIQSSLCFSMERVLPFPKLVLKYKGFSYCNGTTTTSPFVSSALM